MGSTNFAAFGSAPPGLGSSLADGLRPAIIRQPMAQRTWGTNRDFMGLYLTDGDASRDRACGPTIAIASRNRKSNEPPSGLNPRDGEKGVVRLPRFPPSRACGL